MKLSFRKWYDQNENSMPFPKHGKLSKNVVVLLPHKVTSYHMQWHVDDCSCCKDAIRNMHLGAYILAAVVVVCPTASLTKISSRVFANVPLAKPSTSCMVVCIVASFVMLGLVRFIRAMTYSDQAKENYFKDDMPGALLSFSLSLRSSPV